MGDTDRPTSFLAHYKTGPAASHAAGPAPTEPTGTPGGYETTIVREELERMRNATEGTRNATLNRVAFNLHQSVPIDMWMDDLRAAAASVGLGPLETAKTIASAGLAAAQNPRTGNRLPRATTSPGIIQFPTVGPESPHAPSQVTSWAAHAGAPEEMDSEPPPSHLAREDGRTLFYAGRVNGIIGESESGKTWLALEAVRQSLANGEHVLYLDFEDTRQGVARRLIAMGADLQKLMYAAPDETLSEAAKADLAVALEHKPALIIIDGFNAAMTLMGLELNSNTDATLFAQKLLRPLAKTGATVVYVDHLPKNTEMQGKGGIGAQAKRAMTTGCTIRVDVINEFGKGQTGKLKLTVDKDRPGQVREYAAGAKHVGTAILASHLDSTVTVTIQAADTDPRPTTLMNRVLEHLALMNAPVSKNALERDVAGKAETIRWACQLLLDQGSITVSPGPRGALMYRLVPTSSTSSPPRPDEVQTTSSPGPLRGTTVDEVGTNDFGPDSGTKSEDDEPWWKR